VSVGDSTSEERHKDLENNPFVTRDLLCCSVIPYFIFPSTDCYKDSQERIIKFAEVLMLRNGKKKVKVNFPCA
jgi:hypothetical protein